MAFLSGLRIISYIKSVIFEAITEKVQGIKPKNDKSYTEGYQNQKDCICAYKVVCCYDDKHTKPENLYKDENAVYKFMEVMLYEVRLLEMILTNH